MYYFCLTKNKSDHCFFNKTKIPLKSVGLSPFFIYLFLLKNIFVIWKTLQIFYNLEDVNAIFSLIVSITN
jgi:hypothetical protein